MRQELKETEPWSSDPPPPQLAPAPWPPHAAVSGSSSPQLRPSGLVLSWHVVDTWELEEWDRDTCPSWRARVRGVPMMDTCVNIGS